MEVLRLTFLGKSKLSQNSMLRFNYIGENSSVQNCFLEVKLKCRQESLTQNDLESLENDLAAQKDKGPQNYVQRMTSLYKVLELIIYYLSNVSNEGIGQMTLSEYAKTVSLPSEGVVIHFKDLYKNIKLVNLIGFFTFIEEKIYDETEEEVYPQEYRVMIDETLRKDIQNMIKLCDGKNLPSLKSFTLLLKKFVMRQMKQLRNPDESLKFAMENNDIWCDDFETFSKNFKVQIPEGLKVKHLYSLVKELRNESSNLESNPTVSKKSSKKSGKKSNRRDGDI
eukprot:TRINITY_DN5700_c0_g1_i1.p1 TRINITY_DN5700_c0_g1~~TRINITY_DN5700_c0_g1_i1.p1  ORF type:complete len:281 (-),score=27.57 TRINITY_DN5700_c0_g1_i1:114-956(-)